MEQFFQLLTEFVCFSLVAILLLGVFVWMMFPLIMCFIELKDLQESNWSLIKSYTEETEATKRKIDEEVKGHVRFGLLHYRGEESKTLNDLGLTYDDLEDTTLNK